WKHGKMCRAVPSLGWVGFHALQGHPILYAEQCVRAHEYTKGGGQYGEPGHAGGSRALCREDRLGDSTPLARVHHTRLARGRWRDVSAPGLYARELVLGGGAVCRRECRISPSTRDQSEAS